MLRVNKAGLKQLQSELNVDFMLLKKANENIKNKLIQYSNGKVLKGDEIVGWLGEVYAKVLLNGALVADNNEHDVECADGKIISVKARKGYGSGWKNTSAIPKIQGDDCPTHLMFIHLDDDYTVKEAWLYPWENLLSNNRFIEHKVRGEHRAYRFRVSLRDDGLYKVL
jgi:hypothetical protein